MLESGLFFTLGFAAAAFIALMVAPAIWRRAVVLTRQRIESSVPLTLNEIQADKDQLRAEFAMSTRRLELSLEQLKERAAEQLIEVNRKRDQIREMQDDQSEQNRKIAELQAQAEELRMELREREEKLHQSNLAIANSDAKLEERSLEIDSLDRRYRELSEQFDSQKIELVARETRLDNAQDQTRDLRDEMKSLRDQVAARDEAIVVAEGKAKREAARNEQLEKKLVRLQATTSDLEERVERRDRDIARLRDQSGDSSERMAEIDSTLDETMAENIRLKAELADAALRMEALLRDASGENIENAVAVFEEERQDLQTRLQSVEEERDALRVELSAVQLSSGEDWEIERRENAIVRERINDLAAKVTALAASIEGPESPIAKLLESSDEQAALVGADALSEDSADNVLSLADRVRALQATADKAS